MAIQSWRFAGIDRTKVEGGYLEKKDLELIEKHRKDNYELDRLYEEHLRLDEEVTRLESLRVLTPEEQRQLSVLKKTKLDGRDQMERILSTLR